MKFEVLMSCMHQTDDTLVKRSLIHGDVLVINQCDKDGYEEFNTPNGKCKMFHTKERGLTKSRNMAIKNSCADVCLLCDDDEIFAEGYEERIIKAYREIPQADVIIFKMSDREPSFSDKVQRLRFPKILKVSSWQISFKRQSLLDSGISFDELLGAGTGNGAEEELKFLVDCQKKNLKIYYAPEEIARITECGSTWFEGFNEIFFYNRGATTRYILGLPFATAYAVFYVIKKYKKYKNTISFWGAIKAIFCGMKENKIAKQVKKYS